MSVKKIHLFPSEESYVANSGSVEADDLALVPLNLSFNNLSDKPKAYVTETWRSGAQWYRVWSDGFIEQGGNYTSSDSSEFIVTLNKQMKTTYYRCDVTGGYNAPTERGWGHAYDKTTSNFKAVVVEPKGTWEVRGY